MKEKINSFLNKEKKNKQLVEKHNWYKDRYQTVVIQRNFLSLVTLFCLIAVIAAVLTVVNVVESKNIEPFVVEIEEKTGITNVIRPFLKETLNRDETMRSYYIWNYINVREGYNHSTFSHDYYKKVKLWSNDNVYAQFIKSIRAADRNSPLRLGNEFKREVAIKNITYLNSSKNNFTIQVRFSQIDKGTTTRNINTRIQREKVARMSFGFFDLRYTNEERMINPLGFQVISYQVQDEIL